MKRTKKISKTELPSYEKLLILTFCFILLVGFYLPTPENAVESKIERQNELVFVGENSIMAISSPNIIESQVLGSLVDSYYSLITQYDWNHNLAYKIMLCESSGNPKAVGDRNTRYWSYGLMQVRNLPSRNYNVEDLFVPEINIKYAYDIYKQQGWNAWRNCYRKVR